TAISTSATCASPSPPARPSSSTPTASPKPASPSTRPCSVSITSKPLSAAFRTTSPSTPAPKPPAPPSKPSPNRKNCKTTSPSCCCDGRRRDERVSEALHRRGTFGGVPWHLPSHAAAPRHWRADGPKKKGEPSRVRPCPSPFHAGPLSGERIGLRLSEEV